MLLKSVAVALALAVACGPASAHEFKVGDLEIIHPYAFETAPTALTGGGFIKEIVNHGTTADRLVAVKSAYSKTELHQTQEKDGVFSMQPVEGIQILPGGSVTLAPGGYHIMFVGLDGNPFVKNAMVPATLVFENAGEVAVEFHVEVRTSDGAMDDMSMMEGMDHGTTGTNP